MQDIGKWVNVPISSLHRGRAEEYMDILRKTTTQRPYQTTKSGSNALRNAAKQFGVTVTVRAVKGEKDQYLVAPTSEIPAKLVRKTSK